MQTFGSDLPYSRTVKFITLCTGDTIELGKGEAYVIQAPDHCGYHLGGYHFVPHDERRSLHYAGHRLLLYETPAYLEHLAEQGRAERVDGDVVSYPTVRSACS